MLLHHPRFFFVSLLLAVILFSFSAGLALAALDEKPVLDDINDTVAVLHGIELQKIGIEENLEIVHASYALTLRQYEAQKNLYASELEYAKQKENEGDKDAAALAMKRAGMFKGRLDRLGRQMKKLKEFDFDSIYGKQLKALDKQIVVTRLDLDARITEYETLFGKTPHVDLKFLAELREERGKRKDIEHYLKLE